MTASTATTTVLVPAGVIGAGVDKALVIRGIALGVHAIACDAGSTDSGPSYLARGLPKVSRESVKHDLSILMAAAWQAGIPLLIGSCGTSGTDSGVDWTRDIVLELAAEQHISPKLALLYSEQEPQALADKLRQGRIDALPPSEVLGAEALAQCTHIVALMGAEPYIEALRAGADIVLGGRTTDTAILAAVPLMRGADPGAAWHAAKITECGSLCTVNPRGGGVIFRTTADGFEVEPLAPDNACTPYTVSAHMLYENTDPFHLLEPGGTLDVEQAEYVAVNDRVVAVRGSRWVESPYTMKLEGAGGDAFQTIMFIGIADPIVLGALDEFHERMLVTLRRRVDAAIGSAAGDYDISIRIYGWNAVSGLPVPAGTAPPREVGVMFVATAASQEMATRIAKTCNPTFFHFPLRDGMELPSYAYPFSPAEIERGQVYAFRLNHVVHVDSPLELVRTEWVQPHDNIATEAVSAHAS